MNRNWTSTLGAPFLLALIAGSAGAQVANTPDLEKSLQQIGPALTRENVGKTMALYKPLHAQTLPDGVTLLADQSYGPDERNKLDVYIPKGADGTQPIVTFAHGGGFVRGDKSEVANIGAWFASKGIVAIAWNYRFAPKSTYPSGVKDLNGVIAWIHANKAAHKGNAQKIVVAGNSAGAMHTADWMFSDEDHSKSGVIGAILISPPTVNLVAAPLDPQRDALYYGSDASALASASIIDRLGNSKLPLLIAYGEEDIPQVQESVRALVDELYKRDRHLPLLLAAPGHTHISIVEHIGTPDKVFGEELAGFVNLLALRAK